jgi:hypothetical protein
MDDEKDPVQNDTYTTYRGGTCSTKPITSEQVQKLFSTSAWVTSPDALDWLACLIEKPHMCVTTESMAMASNYAIRNQISRVQPFSEGAFSIAPVFDRTKTSHRRDLENQMMADIEKSHPKRDELLSYMSLGSKELLQDVVNIGRLLNAGYKKLAVYLIDSTTPQDLIECFTDLMQRYAQSKQATLDIFASRTMQQHKEKFPNAHMHIVSAVGYDEDNENAPKGAIVAAHSTLDESGKMYLSWSCWDCLFTQKGLEQTVQVSSPWKEKNWAECPNYVAWRQDIEKSIEVNPEKKTVSCAALKFWGMNLFVVVSFLSGLKAKGIQEIHMNFVSDGNVWEKEAIEKYLSLCCRGEMKYTVEIFKSEREYLEAVRTNNRHEDLVFAFDVSRPKDKGTIAVCRNLLSNSHCYMFRGQSLWKYFHKKFIPLYFKNEKDKEHTEIILTDIFKTMDKK